MSISSGEHDQGDELSPAQGAAILAQALFERAKLAAQLGIAFEKHDIPSAHKLFEAAQLSSQMIEVAGKCFKKMEGSNPAKREMEQMLDVLAKRAELADLKTAAIFKQAGYQDVAAWLEAVGNDGDAAFRVLTQKPWDKERDLLILLGQGASKLVPGLIQRGQERIFFQAEPGEKLENAYAIERIEDLDAGSWQLGLPLPRQFRVRQVGPNPLPVSETIARLQDVLPTVNDFGRAFHEMAPKFLRYCSRNLAAIASHPSAESLAGLFPKIPAIIVSAGPSLDKNIHLLREAKGHAVIIGINQTVRALRKAGVKPDIVLACDNQNLAYQFEGTLENDIPALGLGASVNPDLYSIPAERIFTYASSPIIESWIYDILGEKASLRAGGTVSVTALHLAVKMGCSPIVFIGQDFAIDGRKYYATNAADGGKDLAVGADGKSLNMSSLDSKARLAPSQDQEKLYREAMNQNLFLVEVPGFFGQPVKTTLSMRRQILALRAQVGELKGSHDFINSTEGGAFLEGMAHRPLSEVIEAIGSIRIDASSALVNALSTPNTRERMARMRNILRPIAENLRKTVKYARRCHRELRVNKSADARPLIQLKNAAGNLPFLQVLLSSELCEAELRAGDSNVTLEQLRNAEDSLYRTLEKDGAELQPIIDAAIRTLSASG